MLGGWETRPVDNSVAQKLCCLPPHPVTRWSPLQRFRRRGGGGWTSRACYPSCRGDRAERGVSAHGPACDALQAFPGSQSGGIGKWVRGLDRHHVKNAEAAAQQGKSRVNAAGLRSVRPTRRGGRDANPTDSGRQGGLSWLHGREGEPILKRSGKRGSHDRGGLWPTSFPPRFCPSGYLSALALSSEWGPACGVERVSP